MIVSSKVYPEKRKGVDNNVPLQLHVFFDKKRVCVFSTGLRCDIKQWDNEKQLMKKNNVNKAGQTSSAVNTNLNAIRGTVSIWGAENPNGDIKGLLIELRKIANKKEKVEKEQGELTFFESFDEFLIKHPLSDVRKKNFRVIKRALMRFELYKSTKKPFKITFENFTLDILNEFEHFLREEHSLFEKMPEIYLAIPECRTPKKRGQNTINDIFTKIRTFIIWANTPDPTSKVAKTSNNAFGTHGYKIDESVYGTPYYITIEERNQIYNKDLSKHSELAIQRDIFVFQCLIGCRVGDLYNMTKQNVINGAIEYVARKTKDKKKITVRIPLNQYAQDILNRYANTDTDKLLPFVIEQKYNLAIKEIFALSGITRIVTTINPTTGEEEKRPINEIASSHLARRCFIGNLYKKVKDPNLVGNLSGHKEGSKAFARYREIDEEMKIDLVNLLM